MDNLIIITLVILLTIIVVNRKRISKLFTSINKSKNETNLLTKMEQYYEYHFNRLQRLNTTVRKITSAKSGVQKELRQLESKLNRDKFFASEFQKQRNENDVEKIAHRLGVDSKTLDTLKIEFVELNEREKFLLDYQKSYTTVVNNLRYTIDSNKKEYERKKELAQTYDEANEFLMGIGDVETNYQSTLKEYEESTSLFTAQIMDFESRAKTVVDGIKVEDEVKKLEGLRIIDGYNNKLKQLKGFS